MSKEMLCIIMLIVFFAVMIYVGFYSRKHATDVDGFVLGGRGVGPWLTAFAFGTSYFSAVIFVGYAGQFGWNFGMSATWAGLGNACVEYTWKKNSCYDAASGCEDYAGFFREEI